MVSKNASVKDSKGNIVTEPEEVRERWRQYTESLYDRDGKSKIQVEEIEEVAEEEIGPQVLKSEILLAISEMKEGKAVVVDEIPAQNVKKLRRESNARTMRYLSKNI